MRKDSGLPNCLESIWSSTSVPARRGQGSLVGVGSLSGMAGSVMRVGAGGVRLAVGSTGLMLGRGLGGMAGIVTVGETFKTGWDVWAGEGEHAVISPPTLMARTRISQWPGLDKVFNLISPSLLDVYALFGLYSLLPGCSAVGSALRLGRRGRRFESAHPDFFYKRHGYPIVTMPTCINELNP